MMICSGCQGFSFGPKKTFISRKTRFMENNNLTPSGHPRRRFLGAMASGVAALGLSTVISPLQSHAENNFFNNPVIDPDEWFKKLKGKHRIVFDVPEPN